MFNYNERSPFFTFIGRLLDVLLLNFLWLISSIPIITIGASTTAAYSVLFKMLTDREGYIARSFYKEFKANFKKSTFLWILNLTGLYVLFIYWQIVTKTDTPSVILLIVTFLSTFFIFVAFFYVYPITARYDSNLRNTISNSTRLFFKYFIRTLALITIVVFEILLFLWNTPLLIIGVLIGPMVIFYTIAAAANYIFLDLEKKQK
jgi:uncharacterized membrane protein YesL